MTPFRNPDYYNCKKDEAKKRSKSERSIIYMKRWKVIALIPAIVFFGPALVSPGLFKIENSAIQSAIVAIALIALMITAYSLFEFKRVFLYIALGIVFSIGKYMFLYVLWEPYPKISMVMLPIVLLLAITFFGMAAIEAFKIVKRLQ